MEKGKNTISENGGDTMALETINKVKQAEKEAEQAEQQAKLDAQALIEKARRQAQSIVEEKTAAAKKQAQEKLKEAEIQAQKIKAQGEQSAKAEIDALKADASAKKPAAMKQLIEAVL